jgi:hypothetical protein
MCPNCPQLKGNVHATAVQHEATLPMAGDPSSGPPPMAGDPSSGPPPMEGEQEGSGDDLTDHSMIKEPAASAADIWGKNVMPYE